MGVAQRAKVAFWGEAPENHAERKLLLKIDAFVLSFLCLSYWSNYLNRSNLQFAYVSGMKEEIGFQGNDFSLATTVFTVGYTVGQIPHSIGIQYIPARIYLPVNAALWSMLSCCLAATHSPGAVYAIRFLQALFESSTFSGSHWLLGSWYKDAELGKRSALFACCAQLGSLFSGFMQGAIYSSLNGKQGLSGWRWAFIIDGIIGLVIAFYGFCVFPNTPRTTKAFYLTQEERELALSRIPERPHEKLTWRAAWGCIKGWRYWCFSALFTVSSQLEAYGTNGIVPIWLKTTGVNAPKNDYYALGLISVAIATTLICGLMTDIFGHRWRVNIFMGVALIISASMLLVWDIGLGAQYFAFYLGGCGYAGQGSNFAWANELSRSDVERSFILYSMNMWSNAFTAWIIIVIWPVVSAPRYRRGFIFTLPMAVLTMLIAVGTEVAWRRKVRGKKQAVDGESLREKEKEKVERGAAEEKEEVAEAEVANGKGNGHEAEKEDARSDEKHDLSTDTKEHA